MKRLILAAWITACGTLPLPASTIPVNLSTCNILGCQPWTVTYGNGVTGNAHFSAFMSGVSITDDQHRTGSFVGGGAAGDFNGVWYAETQFYLPAGATNAVFAFQGLWGDDRAVLMLNGVDIGREHYADQSSAAGANGTFGFNTTGLPGDAPYVFTQGGNQGTFDDASYPALFNYGKMNTLRIYVNNTDNLSPSFGTRTFTSDQDGTLAAVTATMQYEVPEPATLGLLAAGLFALGAWRRRRA